MVHFLLVNVPKVHLRLECPPGLLQMIGITMYVIDSKLVFNYTTSVVCRYALNVWDLFFAQLHLTIYVIGYYLSLSC